MFRLKWPSSWRLPFHFPELTAHHFAVSLSVFTIVALLIGFGLRNRDLRKLNDRLTAIQQYSVQNQTLLVQQQESMLRRIEILEKEVFGITPPVQKVIIDTGPQAWQRNRDLLLRRRLLELEKHRMKMDDVVTRLRELGILDDEP